MDKVRQKEALQICYKGVADLIHFMAGRVNDLWNVSGLAPLTFFLEPQPKQADNHISGIVH
jgi:hypothetical protein